MILQAKDVGGVLIPFVIDDADAPLVVGKNWRILRSAGGHRYVFYQSYVPKTRKQPKVLLHRMLTNAAPGMDVDHINGNGLDCRRSNLRVCAHSQNLQNAKLSSRSTTKVKNVHRYGDRWRVQVMANGHRVTRFADNIETAAEIAAQLRTEMHGTYATDRAA